MEDEEGRGPVFWTVLGTTLCFAAAGALVARAGGPRWAVRLFSVPAPVLVGNVVVLPVVLGACLAYSVTTGDKSALEATLGAVLDPSGHPLGFGAMQAAAWLTVGEPVSRALATVTMGLFSPSAR